MGWGPGVHVVRLILDLNSVFTRVDLPNPLSPSVCVCVCVCIAEKHNFYRTKLSHCGVSPQLPSLEHGQFPNTINLTHKHRVRQSSVHSKAILNSANYSQWAIIQANESPVGVATQTVYGVMNSILREYNCGM